MLQQSLYGQTKGVGVRVFPTFRVPLDLSSLSRHCVVREFHVGMRSFTEHAVDYES
jgi:hypothetical protein